MRLSPEEAHSRALAMAQKAFEEDFEFRFPTYFDDEMQLTFLCDSNPYKNDRGLRERELVALRQRLHAEGFDILAFATWPAAGEMDAGYTYCLVIDGGSKVAPYLQSVKSDIFLGKFQGVDHETT